MSSCADPFYRGVIVWAVMPESIAGFWAQAPCVPDDPYPRRFIQPVTSGDFGCCFGSH
jgi:hypothetical protein